MKKSNFVKVSNTTSQSERLKDINIIKLNNMTKAHIYWATTVKHLFSIFAFLF